MLTHDLIKLRLVDSGYLPNLPYHLISDAEMCNAFLGTEPARSGISNYQLKGAFFDNYPIINSSATPNDLTHSYENLVLTIFCYLNLYLLYKADNKDYTIPDWVYSYMLGAVISVNSSQKDIHDLILPLGVDNIDDVFDEACMAACNNESIDWLRKSNQLTTVAIPDEYLSVFTNEEETGLLDTTSFMSGTIQPRLLIDVYTSATVFREETDIEFTKAENQMFDRPPTIFGEPHVIKSIRLSASR